MYEEYFGLKRSPFRITPDTSLFYDGGHRGDILGALVYAVHRGEGIVKVVGEVGSGKTMLCRMLQQELPDSVEIIYIANPSVSAEDILFVIANELKFDIARDASKHEVVTMLQNYLLKKHAEDKQVVLFVEEAQGMPLETLEEIRLLSNLETDQHKLLQIILFGQPELDQNLAINSIRQLRERITHDFNLSPLTPKDIHKYLNFRMREVGYTGPELINLKLATHMARYSEGLLRRINILADKMLLSAFADGTHTLTNKHLVAAVKDSGFSRLSSGAGVERWLIWLLGGLVILLALFALAIQNQGGIDFLVDRMSTEGTVRPLDRIMGDGVEPVLRSEAGAGSVEGTVVDRPSATPLVVEPVVVATAAALSLEEAAITENTGVVVAGIAQQTKPATQELQASSKKNQQSAVKLDKVNENQSVEVQPSNKNEEDHDQWLSNKIEASKHWLRNANKQSVSIQVMMRDKSAARNLANYLRKDWPLDLDKTYLYEVRVRDKSIYRVFYDEYPTISQGQIMINQLPASVRVNSPYLHSIYRMQKGLL